MVKIVGGKYRSRNLNTPDEGTLPTKSMVREALFSAIRNDLIDAYALDLFAGSGALGIEALSRGASYCEFVDCSIDAANVVKGNLKTLKEENARVINLGYEAALSKLKEEGKCFDLVLLDPPYKMKDSYEYSCKFLLDNDMLSASACLVLEYEGEIEYDPSPYEEIRHYKYGKTKLDILRRKI